VAAFAAVSRGGLKASLFVLSKSLHVLLVLTALLLSVLGGCARIPEKVAPLEAVSWAALEGWPGSGAEASLGAILESCKALGRKEPWAAACLAAREISPGDEEAVRRFLEEGFIPYRVSRPDGSTTGLITGYYVPDLDGSRQRSDRFSYPVYGVPDDLLVIDLAMIYPELKGYRLRGRLEGRRVVPYWERSQIDGEQAPVKGKELFWVEDPVELFFLHIQGSGRVNLEGGDRVMVNYSDQNGHPYRSIGKLLLDRGEMTRDQMSMQNIMAWTQENPEQVGALLGENPSYVFFRELPAEFQSPPGALGVPLTAGRSLAVDPDVIPLGAPVFLDTTWPGSTDPLRRVMVAQDTGGAIRGAVRADFFWGLGDEAAFFAGRMKQEGRLWVLLPKAFALRQEGH